MSQGRAKCPKVTKATGMLKKVNLWFRKISECKNSTKMHSEGHSRNITHSRVSIYLLIGHEKIK